jgi:hypothetical protein
MGLLKFLTAPSNNTVPVSNNQKKVTTIADNNESINFENIEIRKRSNSSENRAMTEILAKLQNIQK